MHLKRALKEADDQCLLLFVEVQKAWKLASSLQFDLTSHESYLNKLQVLHFVVFLLLMLVHGNILIYNKFNFSFFTFVLSFIGR